MLAETWIPIIRDTFGAIFYITAAVVSILTFIQAKKTVFQPLKIEVFKEQIKILSIALSLFTGKSEVDLRTDFGFDNLLHVNIVRMYDDYAKLFFDAEIDKNQRPYSKNVCRQSVILLDYMEKHFSLADDYKEPYVEQKKVNPDPRTKAAIWDKYCFGEIHIPNKFLDKKDEFKIIMDSPLLPQKLVELMEAYLSVIEKNITQISVILTEVSQQMPEKYPSVEEYEKCYFGWIEYAYNQKFENLEDSAQKITDYIRGYFNTDEIFE